MTSYYFCCTGNLIILITGLSGGVPCCDIFCCRLSSEFYIYSLYNSCIFLKDYHNELWKTMTDDSRAQNGGTYSLYSNNTHTRLVIVMVIVINY